MIVTGIVRADEFRNRIHNLAHLLLGQMEVQRMGLHLLRENSSLAPEIVLPVGNEFF
jgi:hypothetical protein